VASSADHRGQGERHREPGAAGGKGLQSMRLESNNSATDEDDDLVEIDRV